MQDAINITTQRSCVTTAMLVPLCVAALSRIRAGTCQVSETVRLHACTVYSVRLYAGAGWMMYAGWAHDVYVWWSILYTQVCV